MLVGIVLLRLCVFGSDRSQVLSRRPGPRTLSKICVFYMSPD